MLLETWELSSHVVEWLAFYVLVTTFVGIRLLLLYAAFRIGRAAFYSLPFMRGRLAAQRVKEQEKHREEMAAVERRARWDVAIMAGRNPFKDAEEPLGPRKVD